MFEDLNKLSIKRIGLAAGIGLLLMTILAIFAEFNILQQLIIPADPETTINNLRENMSDFRLSIVMIFFIIILDVIVAWCLYLFLSPVNKALSLICAWFRLAYAVMFAAALFHQFDVVYFIENPANLLISDESLTREVMSSISAFRSSWDISLTIFGLHLILAGFLAVRSIFIPKWIGILVMLSGFGYLIDGFGKIISPLYNIELVMFTFIGELIFMGWLIYRGVSKKEFSLSK